MKSLSSLLSAFRDVWKQRIWLLMVGTACMCGLSLLSSTGCYFVEPVKIAATPCLNCHTPDYQEAKAPNHVTAGYSKDCQSCHTKEAWKPAVLNHDQFFPLVDAHKAVECGSCHKNNQYKGTPRTCFGCHQSDYEGVKKPNHVTFKYDKDCTKCHSQKAWKPASIDHDRFFPLIGAHKTAECGSCHKTEQYKGTPRTCIGCHKSDYDGAKEPDHALANYSTECTKCHTQVAWKPSTFDHEPKFPLKNGPHADLKNKCNSCHQDKTNFKKFECINCHEHSKPKMDAAHQDENDYVYASPNCLKCHPKGVAED